MSVGQGHMTVTQARKPAKLVLYELEVYHYYSQFTHCITDGSEDTDVSKILIPFHQLVQMESQKARVREWGAD